MSDPVGEKLYDAAQDGRVPEVSSLLRDHLEINVNKTEPYCQWTTLHAASRDQIGVVKLLLAHPSINVNLRGNGQTPLSLGCEYGKVSVVEVLLKDPRIDVTLEDFLGRTPL